MSGKHGSAWLWLAPIAAFAIGFAIARVDRIDGDARGARAETSITASARRSATVARALIGNATRVAPTAALPPMPAADGSLSDTFDALAARARAGDVAAASRLLDETSHCLDRAREVAELQRPPPERVKLALPDGGEGFYARIERERARAAEDAAATASLCDGVDHDITATTGEWLQRAAAGGDDDAAGCYASTQDRFAPEKFSDGWIAWMRDYRALAVSYGERSLAAGRLDAVGFLYDTYAGPYGGIGYAIDSTAAPDFARAYRLALLQSRLATPANSDDARAWRVRARLIERELSPAQTADARAWAAATADRFLASPPMPSRCHGIAR